MKFLENIMLAPYTTFKIGGPAKFFCEAANKTELKNAVSWAKEKSLLVFILGGGSNILVSDDGFDGLVIKMNLCGIKVAPTQGRSGFVEIEASAGENWDDFVEFAVSRNFAGVECLSGIPGTVGAAPAQNIGAYGQSAAQTIDSVFAVNLKIGEEVVLKNNDCDFGYRTSRFKKNPAAYAVTAVRFLLKPGGVPTLAYHDLKNFFLSNALPTLADVRRAVLEIRARKDMVVSGEELHSSVGSFFTNPTISLPELEDLKLKAAVCKETKNCCADPWFWPRKDGRAKVSAACLIECAGFEKGMRVGNAGISPLHSLALINYGGASAKEILGLANEIIMQIKEKFGINLEIEPQLVGF